MATDMQCMGFAISPDGLLSLFTESIGPQIAEQLAAGLVPPPYTMPPPTPSWSYTIPPPQGEGTADIVTIEDYALNLTDGAFTTFAPAFDSYIQDQNAFTLTLLAPGTVVGYAWDETFNQETQAGWKTTNDPKAWSGPYSQTFASFEIQVQLELQYVSTSNEFTIGYAGCTTDPGASSASIPSGSVLSSAPQASLCDFGGTVQSQVDTALESIDFGTNVSGLLASYLYTIPTTGDIGAMSFHFTPSAGTSADQGSFQFPSGGGVTGGVTGDVEVNSSWYSDVVAPPAGVPIPAIPTQQVAYNVQDYEFNALFWGFTEADLLDVTLDATEIGPALETKTYYATWPQLYMIWPSDPMTAALAPIDAATVTFQIVYQLNTANLAQIQAALGPTVWAQVGTALTEGVTGTYITQQGFEWQLTNADAQLGDYEGVIEQYAAIPGVVVSQDLNVALSVVSTNPTPGQDGAPANPILTFDVAGQWVMLDVGLAASSTAGVQSIVFALQTPSDYDVLPVTTFVQSTIPGTTSSSFENLWPALETQWQNTMTTAGEAGVALPRFPGFDFDMNASVVTIVVPPDADGYVSVLADVTFGS